MRTRDIIKSGEAFLLQWNRRKETLEAFMAQEDSHAVQYLLQIQITDTEDKIANTHKKLELGRRDWESEMDRHSAEVNCHQKKIFDDAFSLFNKEPLGITDKMKALVKRTRRL